MSMFLRKKWLLPSILNFVDPKPQEPSAQILSFLEQPGDKSGNVVVLLSDKFNYIGAVLLKESLIEYKKDNPGYSDLRSLKGGIIALIDYNFKPDKNWTNIVIEIEKFNFICNSEPVGEPALITKDDVAEVLKIYKRGGKDDDDNNHSLSQASQLVEMADLLSQVDDSVNQSIRRTSKADQEEMDLSESDFIIPEDQRKQLDRIPGWVDEELSQAPPSQVASVNASLLPSVSQSVHKSPAKAPTEFYQGQPPLQLAVDASIEDSEEGNQSKDQDQMNIEKDVLGDNLQQAGDVAEAINGATPSKNDSTKVDETFDEETQGPEELANIQTQSLPMTLSTGDLAKSAEKPAAETATANEEQNKAKETKKKKKSDKAKDSKKKKEKPAASESEPVEAASSQKSTGETSKSNRSTRSKKKTAKNSVSQSTGENATGEKTTEKPKSKKKSDKAKEGTQDKRTDKAEDKTKDKKEKKKKEKKSKKDKKDKKKKRKSATESSSGTASSNNTSLAAPEPTPGQEAQPVATEQLEQPPAAQPAVGKPAEVPVLTTTEIIDNASILIQETVVLHDQHVEHEKDPNKIYDEQNRTIPNLNDEDMDSMMMSFHQELESASQLDLNAVPDYIVEVSPDKSSYPIIRDLGSPLITSHTSSQAASSQQGGLHFGHSNQEFSLGMPSDASSQARNVAPSQAVVDAVNNNNVNNASEGSEDNAGKSSSSISQELISGTMRNVSPEKAQPEAPAKEKHSLLEEMLMSDPAEANNITDSQVDNTDGAEYFTQHPDLLGDSESQWEGARAPATQGVVPVVPQSQGDLHSEFFSSSDDSGKDKQSQNSGQNAKTTEPKDTENVTPTTSPTSKKDSISPKARRHLEFNLDKDAPNSPTKSQPVSTSQHSSNRFKFSLPKPATANPQKRINLSTQPQTQLPRVIATSPPKFKRPAAKSPPKDNAPVQPSVNTNSPTKTAPKAQSSPEKRSVPEKEIEKGVEQEVAVDNSFEEEDSDLEITSEQRPPDDSPPPLIRVNSTNLREEGEVQRPRERSRSKSPSPGESKSKSREEKDDTKLKYVIDLEDLSPRFFNKTKKATDNNTNKVVRSRDKSNSGSGLSSQETTVSPQNRTPSAVVKKANINKKSPSPNSRPGSLGDLIRQSRQQSLASKDPTMEFVIGYFKEVTSEPKAAPAVRAPRFSPNANSNNNGSGSTAGVKRKIDYYGWLDLTSNKKRKLDHNDNKK